MEKQPKQQEIMMNFIDKLCDHLGNDRIKLLIDSGFDEWETITYMKGHELVQLGFSAQQCIVVMVSANATAKQHQSTEIFTEQQMKLIIQRAKQQQLLQKQYIPTQENPTLGEQYMNQKTEKEEKDLEIKEYAMKEVNQALLWKGTSMKPTTKGQKLSTITMISLQEKALTHMRQFQKLPALQILHLSRNHIYKIQNLQHCNKIKTLKLDHNQILKIEGLQTLQLLQKLSLNDNHISCVEGLVDNRRLHFLDISNQKTNKPMKIQSESMEAMGYCLQNLQCNNNRVENIQNFRHLSVIKTILIQGSSLAEIGELSDALGAMQMLKSIDFRNSPITKVPKYRDYIVILSKSLQQLDGKKILPSQREYLIKLYSLKHMNQAKEGHSKPKPNSSKQLDLQGIKMQESHSAGHKFHQGVDLRGNVPYQNTKILPHHK